MSRLLKFLISVIILSSSIPLSLKHTVEVLERCSLMTKPLHEWDQQFTGKPLVVIKMTITNLIPTLTWQTIITCISLNGPRRESLRLWTIKSFSTRIFRPSYCFECEELHQPFFFVLSMAVGGGYTRLYHERGITAELPAELMVDYIRIYDNGFTQLSWQLYRHEESDRDSFRFTDSITN